MAREQEGHDQGNGGNRGRRGDGESPGSHIGDQPRRPPDQHIDDEMEGGAHDTGGQAAQGRQEVQGAIGDRLLCRPIS